MTARWISMFAHLRATEPLGRSVTVEAIAKRLGRFDVCESREQRSKSVPLWSPVVYRSGTTRASRNVAAVHWLVLDYDDGTTVDVARARWDRWVHIGHTTYSHMQGRPATKTQPDGRAPAPALRVVLPLARPVDADFWPDVMRQVLATVGVEADRKCIDPARMFYVPVSKPGGAQHHWVHLPREQYSSPYINLDRLVQVAVEQRAERQREIAKRKAKAQARRGQVVETNDARDREVRRLLLEDGAAREQLGVAIGGNRVERTSGAIVRSMTCPACGRQSVWFFVEPSQLRRAKCNHENSCGWTGHLWELAAANGFTI